MPQGEIVGFSSDQDGVERRKKLGKFAHNLVAHQYPIGIAVRAGDEIIEAVRKGIDYFSHFLSFQLSGFHQLAIRTPSFGVHCSAINSLSRVSLNGALVIRRRYIHSERGRWRTGASRCA